MSSNFSGDTDEILKDLNTEMALTLVPTMLFCAILMAFGTVGNIMVVYFYAFRSKTTSATCFILSLAIFDLIACIFGIPIEISDMRYFYLFENVALCRLLVLVNHFATISSAFTLCAIAVDRYKRICKPFDRQMTVRKSKLICIMCAILGVLLGWPSCVLYTVEKVDINTTYNGELLQLTGFDCTSVKTESLVPYNLAYSGVQFCGFFGITIALIASYFLVGRQLYKHKKFRFYVAQKQLRRTASGNMTTMTSNTDYSSDNVVNNVPITSIPEEEEEELEEVEYEGPDDDPPLMQETIPDLRELLELDIGGLPDVDSDSRPPSALREFLAHGNRPSSRTSSILTDLSARSKAGSIMTVRSVTICDMSENQIYDIEPRDKNSASTSWRPRSARSDSTWSNSINRNGSINSINSINSYNTISRPSSVTSIHSITELSGPKTITDDVFPSETSSKALPNSLANGKRANGLKRTRSDGCVETGTLRRNSSSASTGKPKGLKRTTSEGSALKRTSSNGSVSSRKGGLRRTSSSDSAKMNTDIDPLKDMRMKMLDLNTVKYTFIMITIALVFILSCVPFLALTVWRVYADENMVYELSSLQQVWFQIGLRSYFLNCAINPFIYGFFNSQFRDFFYNAWCTCCAGCCCATEVVTSEDEIEPDIKIRSPRSLQNKGI